MRSGVGLVRRIYWGLGWDFLSVWIGCLGCVSHGSFLGSGFMGIYVAAYTNGGLEQPYIGFWRASDSSCRMHFCSIYRVEVRIPRFDICVVGTSWFGPASLQVM